MDRIKKALIKLHWLLASQFGLDPQRFLRSLRGLPHFVRDWVKFRKGYTGELSFMPCLHDRYEEGGATNSEYFWQDLLVARWINEAKPAKHVDIGSRVDGFVAHVASFREIEVIDFRPITAEIPSVTFKQADLMRPLEGMEGYCDSLSCLHALEHFGLGRYGDPVDSNGFERGFNHMARLLEKDGIFYLSVPLGMDRVEFNANRVFDPRVIVKLALENSLKLAALTLIRQEGKIIELALDEAQIEDLIAQRYALGVFTFVKTS